MRTGISRAWSDIAPKLLAFFTGAGASTAIVFVLNTYFGISIDPALASVIATVVGTVLGYVVKDTTHVSAIDANLADAAEAQEPATPEAPVV